MALRAAPTTTPQTPSGIRARPGDGPIIAQPNRSTHTRYLTIPLDMLLRLLLRHMQLRQTHQLRVRRTLLPVRWTLLPARAYMTRQPLRRLAVIVRQAH